MNNTVYHLKIYLKDHSISRTCTTQIVYFSCCPCIDNQSLCLQNVYFSFCVLIINHCTSRTFIFHSARVLRISVSSTYEAGGVLGIKGGRQRFLICFFFSWLRNMLILFTLVLMLTLFGFNFCYI
ncbi:uncharacterized protein [Diabrotica undecimpunctata]|uniref:uncharacterized protein isoform X1 n=1 Tax=Diabrotica undecimpunctata TaxID=50387 RepID=UPI003B63278F